MNSPAVGTWCLGVLVCSQARAVALGYAKLHVAVKKPLHGACAWVIQGGG